MTVDEARFLFSKFLKNNLKMKYLKRINSKNNGNIFEKSNTGFQSYKECSKRGCKWKILHGNSWFEQQQCVETSQALFENNPSAT